MASLYGAHPLAPGKSADIRLIELLRVGNGFEDPYASISCRLCVVSLNDAPKYTALSYVWGSPEPSMTIVLDDQLATVRGNLWEFLHEYRRDEHRSLLWIDALCIDQKNDDERSHQVSIMAGIFSDAESVIAWLGVGVEQDVRIVSEYARDTESSQHLALLESAPEILRQSVERVLQAEYWSRLWIVQEFVLGRSVELWSGEYRLDGDAFAIILCPETTASSNRVYVRRIMQPVDQIELAMAVITCRHEHHLTKPQLGRLYWRSSVLVQRFKRSKCADVRDRLFGLLGLIDPEELRDHPIHVDYAHMGVNELFIVLWERTLYFAGLDAETEAKFDPQLSSHRDDLIALLELPADYSVPGSLTVNLFLRFWEKSSRLRKVLADMDCDIE